MAGAIGGGGLGKIAINYGYYKYNYAVMLIAVVFIVVLVQIFQSLGTSLPPGRTTASPTGLGEESSVGTSAGRSTGTSAAPAACEFWRGRQSSCFAPPLFCAEYAIDRSAFRL